MNMNIKIFPRCSERIDEPTARAQKVKGKRVSDMEKWRSRSKVTQDDWK